MTLINFEFNPIPDRNLKYRRVLLSLSVYIYIYISSPKPIRKAKGYLMFTGGSKGNIGKKKVKNFSIRVNISFSLVM